MNLIEENGKKNSCHFLNQNNSAVSAIASHFFEDIYYFGDKEGKLSIEYLNMDSKKIRDSWANVDAH